MTAQRPNLHIVVTCANRKRHPVPTRLQLRRVTGVRIATRLRSWTERLTTGDVQTVVAGDLYAGEHWDIARGLPACAASFNRTTLWVASAGWGLIRAQARIRPYSAAFAPGHPDSVPDGYRGAQDWWNALTRWPGPEPAAPRSLAGLIADHSRDRVLVVLSHTYFAACTGDLAEALRAGSSNQRVSIISAGAAPDPDFNDWQLQSDARLRRRLGGTLGSINVRIAAHLLRTGLVEHDAMQRHLRRMLAKAPTLPVYRRQSLTDAQIRQFIRTRRRQDATLSRTSLLRELRDTGMACEQRRFAELFVATEGVTP